MAGVRLTVSVLPLSAGVRVGDTLRLSPTVSAVCNVVFDNTDSTAIRQIDSTRFVALRTGSVTLTARVVGASVDVPVVVMPAIAYMPRRYRVVDVQTANPDSTQGPALGEHNEVLANLRPSGGGIQPVIWRNGSMTMLTGCKQAVQITASGQVVCYADPGLGLWQDGTFSRVAGTDTLAFNNHFDLALNDSGGMAGSRPMPCSGCKVFYIHAGKVEYLDAALGSSDPQFGVVRLNNAGTILGSSFQFSYSTEISVVKNNQLVDRFNVGSGAVADMNDADEIVGTTLGHPGNEYVLARGVKDFPITSGEGRSINNREQIVGLLIRATYPYDLGTPDFSASASGPFYWDRTLGIVKLANAATDPAWTITNALQINDAGTILAVGDNVSSGLRNRIVLLVPVQ